MNRRGRKFLAPGPGVADAGTALRLLAGGKAMHKTGSRHQVWQEGFHPQAILHDDAMMIQKLEYIHNNPVRRGWVASPEHWRWSSAHEGLVGASPVFRMRSLKMNPPPHPRNRVSPASAFPNE